MAEGVVFKQSYKPVNEKRTPMLNGKHLIYIATRKGAIHNKDCAFGLFGRLPYMEVAADINNLESAHTVITSVSRRRTIYRAILSVDDETAKNHGLYERAVWQQLVTEKISVLAGENEMNIERQDFCWAASMHYAKGHPHVHVMYWDNGNKTRQESVSELRFKIMAEHIREAFGKGIYKEELKQAHGDQRDIGKEARLELMAMFRECNLMEALNLNAVSAVQLDDIGARLYKLVISVPKTGSFKYRDMPTGYKEQFKALLDELLKIPDFQKLQSRYLGLADKICDYYGYGKDVQEVVIKDTAETATEKLAEDSREKARNDAKGAFEKELGNELLSFIRSYKKELAQSVPKDIEALKSIVKDDVEKLLQNNPKFAELQKMMPKFRTPIQEIMTDDFKLKKDELVKEIISDIRVRMKINAYIGNLKKEQNTISKAEGSVFDDKAMSKEIYAQFLSSTDNIVLEKLYQESGYEQQFKNDMALNVLIQIFGSASQRFNQHSSRFQLDKIRSKDKSKTALQDLRKQKEQQGYWEPEW